MSAPHSGRDRTSFTKTGEMADLIHSYDWSATSLGRIETWPQNLKTVADLMVASRFPMFIAWGPELVLLYNDSYASILGTKHPRALGARFIDVWSDIWGDILPFIDSALAGKATWIENLPLVMNRNGYDEETYFTFSYSPIRGDDGAIAGMYCAVAETTTQVRAQRELRESEEDARVLVSELQHRTRNLLGVVRSLAENTLARSTTLADFQERFRERLAALARVNSLLSRLEPQARIDFDELIHAELSAHGLLNQSSNRITLDGAEGVCLRSSTVQTLALGLHELATNALKYGALSGPEGRLTIRWAVTEAGDKARLNIEWLESGAPIKVSDEAQARRGYGREFIERALPYQLGAETQYEITPEYVRCTISLPLS